MAKYTELFAEYLEGGGELPAVFSLIEGFADLFVGRFCDKEIGFETEALFAIKLNERAAIIIPEYVKRLQATDAAWLTVTDPTRTQTRAYVGGERRTATTALPVNTIYAEPNQTGKAEEYTDTETVTNNGLTPDESIRRVEYFQKLDGTAWIILDSCLREFDNLFMKVY